MTIWQVDCPPSGHIIWKPLTSNKCSISVDSGENLVARSCALDSDGQELQVGDRTCLVIEVDAAVANETDTEGGEGTAMGKRMLNGCIDKCREECRVCHLLGRWV